MSHSVLIYGHDPLLLRTRDLLLRNEGFQVLTATNRTDALGLLSVEKIDLLLGCHSLSDEEFHGILAVTHVLPRPPRVLALIAGNDRPNALADFAVVNIFDGPKTFLAAVHGLIDPGGPQLP